MTTPGVSVVVATYDREALLGRAIDSIQAQTFGNWELIVVDDGSTDGTPRLVQTYVESDSRVTLVRQPNRGRCAARNAGASLAKAPWLAFLDSDDEAKPEWLERLVGAAGERVGVVCCGAQIVLNRPDVGVVEERVRLPHDRGPVYDNVVGLFMTGTLLIRRAVFESLGGYEESLEFSENTDLTHRLLPELESHGLSVATVMEDLVIFYNQRAVPTGAASAARLHAARWILDHHGDRYWRGDRGAYSNYCAIAARACSRLDDRAGALRWTARAIRAAPWRLVNLARLLRYGLIPLTGPQP